MANIEKQLREYFQNSNVMRELITQGEKSVRPDARKRPYEPFSPSDDEQEKTPTKKAKRTPKKKGKAKKVDEDTSEESTEVKKTYRTRSQAKISGDDSKDEKESEKKTKSEKKGGNDDAWAQD